MCSGREERDVVCGSERLRDVFSGAMGVRMILTRLSIVGSLMSKIWRSCTHNVSSVCCHDNALPSKNRVRAQIPHSLGNVLGPGPGTRLQLVNRHLSDLSTHTLLQNNRRVHPTSQLVGYSYTNRDVDFSQRLLPTMPIADFLSAEDEYVRVLSLIPTDDLGKTVIDVEIFEQLSVGE
jgi:hypothetical protein